jgi:hypothetical protein
LVVATVVTAPDVAVMRTLALEAVFVGATGKVVPAAVASAEVSTTVTSAGEVAGRSVPQAPATITKPTAVARDPVNPMHF